MPIYISISLFIICSILLTYLLFVSPVVHVHVQVLSAVLSAIRHSPIGVPRPNGHSGGKRKKTQSRSAPAAVLIGCSLCMLHCVQLRGQSQPPPVSPATATHRLEWLLPGPRRKHLSSVSKHLSGERQSMEDKRERPMERQYRRM